MSFIISDLSNSFQLMHDMPVIPQSGPQQMYSGPTSMPQPYGLPGGQYMSAPGLPPNSGMPFPHPSYLPAYNGYMPSDPAMYAGGSAPPPPTPPLQGDQHTPHP
jgi:hypothetical protein